MSAASFTLRWGILATGGIAEKFAKDLLTDPQARDASDIQHEIVAAASSTSHSRAQAFLQRVQAPTSAEAYGSYTDLVSNPNVDIVYVATPHSHHYQNVRLCLEFGKHVLVEKPMTVNAEQARVLIDIARERKRFFMEAVWTRFFPVSGEVREFVKSGQLGEVKRVWADLSFWNDVEKEFGTEHRMVKLDLAGGALLDLGVYSLTWVFQILYHIVPKSQRGSPAIVSSMTKYEATGCDENTSMILAFPSGAHGIATTNIRVAHGPNPSLPSPAPVRIQGTLGDLHISSPPYQPVSYTLIPASSSSRGTLASFTHETVTRDVPAGGQGMFWEADECARCIRDGKLESPIMPLDESLLIMEVMDEVRRQGSLKYPQSVEKI